MTRPTDLIEHALATTAADRATVLLRHTTSANLRWANNTLTTNGVMRDQTMTVISFADVAGGVATGSVTGSATTTEQVTALVEAADAAARASGPAEDAADPVPGDDTPGDWDDDPATTDIGVYADLAPALGDAFGTARDAGRVLYGFVDHIVTTTWLATSAGLRRRHVQPTGHWGCTGKTADLASSAWVGGSGRDFADVDPAAMDAELARRLGWSSRRLDLPEGRYDTVLPPAAVADLLIYAYWSASARIAHEGQSVYSRRGATGDQRTRIGEKVARPSVSLWSDPAHPELACEPFVVASASSELASVFDNGLPLRRTDWIRQGELSALLQTRETAALTGQPVTPGIDNLVLDAGGTGSLDDVVAATGDGLLLTCLWYIREVDPQTLLLTGLSRDGVYRVEGGEVTGAVNNFRFNESPIDLLGRFSHASRTESSFSREWGDYFPRTATPALRVPDFNMSSVSRAM
jgi:predicted Zn-dependent protease